MRAFQVVTAAAFTMMFFALSPATAPAQPSLHKSTTELKSDVFPITLPAGIYTASDEKQKESSRASFQKLVASGGDAELKSYESGIWLGSDYSGDGTELIESITTALKDKGYEYKETGTKSSSTQFFTITKSGRTWRGYWGRGKDSVTLAWGEVGSKESTSSTESASKTVSESDANSKSESQPSSAPVGSSMVMIQMPGGVGKPALDRITKLREKYLEFLEKRGKGEKVTWFEPFTWKATDRAPDSDIQELLHGKLTRAGYKTEFEDEKDPGSPFTSTNGKHTVAGYWLSSGKELTLLWGEVEKPGTPKVKKSKPADADAKADESDSDETKETPSRRKEEKSASGNKAGEKSSDDAGAEALRRLFK